MGESRQLSDARVVVGLDFGTTFSGFAYAHINEPDAIHTVYEWPMQSQGGGKPYCKTQTSLLYAKSRGKKSRWSQNPTAAYEVHDWGWPAQIAHLAKSHRLPEGSAPAAGHGHEFVERFKLLLAPPAAHSDSRGSRKGRRWLRWLPKLEKKPGAVKLPPGVSVQRAVSDYLGNLAQFAVEHLQSKYGSHINLELYLSGMGAWRSNSFDAFVRRGDAVAVDQCVTKCYQPLIDTLPMNLAVYSSSDVNPSSVTDRGCRLEGSLLVDPSQKLLPDSGSKKHVNTSMHFGRTHLQVTAQRVNFGDTQEVLMFKHAMPFQY